MALDVVSDYVAKARELLQDQGGTGTYRYQDSELVNALTLCMTEAIKLRPDLFLGYTFPASPPVFTANDNTPVVMDPMYRVPLVYYMVGMAQLRDDEEVQDQRAAAFMSMFAAKLTTLS